MLWSLISDKGDKTIQWGKEIVYLTNSAGTTIYPHTKQSLWTPYLISCTKINKKSIIDLNIRAKIIKLLEEIIEVNICDLELGKAFNDTKVQATTTTTTNR